MKGAAPPMTPKQRAFIQSVHEARLARRRAALERHQAKLQADEKVRGLEEAARNRALAEAAEAQERDLAERQAKEAAELEASQRAAVAHYEATRPRTLAELVEASLAGEPRSGATGTGTGSRSALKAHPGRFAAPSAGPRRPTGRS